VDARTVRGPAVTREAASPNLFLQWQPPTDGVATKAARAAGSFLLSG